MVYERSPFDGYSKQMCSTRKASGTKQWWSITCQT